MIKNNIPWADKYRPKKLDEIVGNKDIIEKLKLMQQKHNIINIMFYGPSGTGKSSSIKCLISPCININISDILELNASDDRGINVIRDEILSFVKKKSNLDKLVILEEIDNMTQSSQHGLCSIMDQYGNTKFFLSCNNYENVIESIQSRCIIFKFEPLTNSNILERLTKIVEEEKFNYNLEGLKTIAEMSEGDLRIALNILQSVYYGFQNITKENIFKITVQPLPELIDNILLLCNDSKTSEAISEITKLWNKGYDISDIISLLFKRCQEINCEEFNEEKRIYFLKHIGETYVVIIDGVKSLLQLQALIIRLSNYSIEKY